MKPLFKPPVIGKGSKKKTTSTRGGLHESVAPLIGQWHALYQRQTSVRRSHANTEYSNYLGLCTKWQYAFHRILQTYTVGQITECLKRALDLGYPLDHPGPFEKKVELIAANKAAAWGHKEVNKVAEKIASDPVRQSESICNLDTSYWDQLQKQQRIDIYAVEGLWLATWGDPPVGVIPASLRGSTVSALPESNRNRYDYQPAKSVAVSNAGSSLPESSILLQSTGVLDQYDRSSSRLFGG